VRLILAVTAAIVLLLLLFLLVILVQSDVLELAVLRHGHGSQEVGDGGDGHDELRDEQQQRQQHGVVLLVRRLRATQQRVEHLEAQQRNNNNNNNNNNNAWNARGHKQRMQKPYLDEKGPLHNSVRSASTHESPHPH
jgi:hypothetical protein